MKEQIAKHIVEKLNESLGIMDTLLFNVKDELTDEEYSSLRRSVARVMNTIDGDVINKIIKEYPELHYWKSK